MKNQSVDLTGSMNARINLESIMGKNRSNVHRNLQSMTSLKPTQLKRDSTTPTNVKQRNILAVENKVRQSEHTSNLF